MIDRSSDHHEQEPKRFPTSEEVRGQLMDLIGHDFTVLKTSQDEKGLFYLEVTVPSEVEGDFLEYSYTREGVNEAGTFTDTAIHVAEFVGNEYVHGTSIAKYVGGVWVRQ